MSLRKRDMVCRMEHTGGHYILYTTPPCYEMDAEVFHMKCVVCFRVWDVSNELQ